MEKLRVRDLESPQESAHRGLHGLQLRRRHRQAAVAAAAHQRTARRRTPPQEHVRVGDAGDRRRARSTRCSATSGCSATRWTARRLWTHKIDPTPRYLDFGTAASPVVHDGRVYLLDDNESSSYIAALRREDRRRCCGGRRARSAATARLGLVHAVRLGERAAHRDRRDRHAASRSATALDGKELWRLKGRDAGQSRRPPKATACSSSAPDPREKRTVRCSP